MAVRKLSVDEAETMFREVLDRSWNDADAYEKAQASGSSDTAALAERAATSLAERIVAKRNLEEAVAGYPSSKAKTSTPKRAASAPAVPESSPSPSILTSQSRDPDSFANLQISNRTSTKTTPNTNSTSVDISAAPTTGISGDTKLVQGSEPKSIMGAIGSWFAQNQTVYTPPEEHTSPKFKSTRLASTLTGKLVGNKTKKK